MSQDCPRSPPIGQTEQQYGFGTPILRRIEDTARDPRSASLSYAHSAALLMASMDGQ